MGAISQLAQPCRSKGLNTQKKQREGVQVKSCRGWADIPHPHRQCGMARVTRVGFRMAFPPEGRC